MKNELWCSDEMIRENQYEVIEVISGMKSLALVVEFAIGDGMKELGLYRPEKGVFVSVDPRVIKPAELYRDVAYSKIYGWMGWQGVAAVYPWQLDDNDKGVIRPYWKNVRNMDIYQFSKSRFEKDGLSWWKSLALADYIFGVGDRGSNDFLLTDGGIRVVDSGFSFLHGTDFIYQQSIIRDAFRGDELGDTLKSDLEKYISDFDIQIIEGLIGEEEIYWVNERIKRIIDNEKMR